MATPHASAPAISPSTLITIKITVNDAAKKLKLPLRDLNQHMLLPKLRHVLDVQPAQHMTVERYSDSAGGYITLDDTNAQVFKTLIRAAKAKLKLRLKATVTPLDPPAAEEKVPVEPSMPAPSAQPNTMLPAGAMSVPDVPSLQSVQSSASRGPTAYDQRSVGSGIFRQALASQQTLVDQEAPLPRPFVTNQQPFFDNLAAAGSQQQLAFRTRETTAPVAAQCSAWSVYCNACDKAMLNAHFHCSICDGGDYDLCEECVANGSLCPGEGHWLIKRFIHDGKVVNSTTERVQPSKAKVASPVFKSEPEAEKEMPGSFAHETKTLAPPPREPTRTCNNCVILLPEREFVHCTTCDDFDLCIKCHTADKHGHHPAHAFEPATAATVLPLAAEHKLAAGRNVRHNAICDGCDKNIYGVRHKCLHCPDWDYCNDCVKDAHRTHPGHRFAALYQPIPDQYTARVNHYNIYCDGPLCNGAGKAQQYYIQGVRYKCTICHDTDFCAACEAAPCNTHNRTHPLIKLKTPVRNVNISTESEDPRGNVRVMGDRAAQPAAKESSTEVTPAQPQQTNAATCVQTVAEITPTEVDEAKPASIKLPIMAGQVEPISIPVKKFVETTIPALEVQTSLLNAHFVHDAIPDGKVFEPETRFTQVWTLKNPGPVVWPAGCSVRYTGGDNMLNLDNSHPASVDSIGLATESNVVGREVAIGEEIAFKVLLKAPKREGKSISYWRIKAADGTPFGHRLWCDIEVKKTEPETLPSQSGNVLTPAAIMAARLKRQQQQQQQQQARENVMKLNPAMPTHMPRNNPVMGPHTVMPAPPFINYRASGRAFPGPVPMPLPSVRLQQPSAPALVEQPPVYEGANIASRLAAMREHQKSRREQMIAQMQAQRETLQALGPKAPETTEQAVRDARLDTRRQQARVSQRAFRDKRMERYMQASEEAAAADPAAVEKSNQEQVEQEKLAQEKINQLVEEKLEKLKMEKVQKIAEEATKALDESNPAATKEVEEKLEGSQMVFPKLEKESPESSTYQSFVSHSDKGKAAYVENEEGEVEQTAATVAAPAAEVPAPSVSSPIAYEEEDFESVDDELEVLSALGEDSEDDGFVTDEEYDILDASDQETVA